MSWMFGEKPKVNGSQNPIREERSVGVIISDLIDEHLKPLLERIEALEEKLKNGN